MSEAEERLVWIDLEMTGLDVTKESIIEIATVVTDGELNIIAQGPNLAINVEESLLAGMDEWNTSHHTSSGLVERVRQEGVSIEEAEERTLQFLQEWVPEGRAPLCGNGTRDGARPPPCRHGSTMHDAAAAGRSPCCHAGCSVARAGLDVRCADLLPD